VRVNREALLRALEDVAVGTSKKEVVEQASCVAFQSGRVWAFNGEILVSAELEFPLEGAVGAEALRGVVGKLPDGELDVVVGDDGANVQFRGDGRRLVCPYQAEIHLPIQTVPQADEWRPVPDGFLDALDTAYQCTGQDRENGFVLTCVSITPEWVEACDAFQAVRVLGGLPGAPVLMTRDGARAVARAAVDEYSMGDGWCHFRASGGRLEFACRLYNDTYPDLGTAVQRPDTSPSLTLGPSLGEVVERAVVVLDEGGQIGVALRPGGMRLTAQGPGGMYEELKRVAYTGPAVSFQIGPGLLEELCKRSGEVLVDVSPGKVGRLLVVTPSYTYAVSVVVS
jgi:hypothetical protein